MSVIFVNMLKKIIKNLAAKTVGKFEPEIIAITGSVGKTSAKEAVRAVVSEIKPARTTAGNFNNEIGVPLTILSGSENIGGKFFWGAVISFSIVRLLLPRRLFKYPEMLVLEYAADKPGDVKYLLEIARPKIGVVTAVGEIPPHVEFYSGPDAVAREKSKLIEDISVAGFALLNYDEQAVIDMKERSRAKIMTFGFGEGSDVRISAFENRSENGAPEGVSFKLEHGGSFVPTRLDGVFGKTHAYAAAAAACVGLISGLNLVKISEALLDYRSPKGRMAILAGIKGSFIIDDSYNASPLSVHSALDALKELKAARKIAVLGDMLEIGQYSIQAHETVGRLAAKSADILVTVGAAAKLIAESAAKTGMPKENVVSFDTAEEAGRAVQDFLRPKDVVLIKASRAVGLDKVVEEIKAAPIV
ncbi:MAG: UDP-N-acetylmuramoyl-tripeptide--D-alanyl-D-alanine ligase [Patescibacteria group bacterium]